MSAILSIKPKYCEEILKGKKKYEFRKRVFKRRIKSVFMYSTSPIKKIVGLFTVGPIVEGSPKKLWRDFRDFSGVEKADFFKYFDKSKRAFAIRIEEVKSFEPINPELLVHDFAPPQSYMYIKKPWKQTSTP